MGAKGRLRSSHPIMSVTADRTACREREELERHIGVLIWTVSVTLA
jgi:hypothetical protein